MSDMLQLMLSAQLKHSKGRFVVIELLINDLHVSTWLVVGSFGYNACFGSAGAERKRGAMSEANWW